MTHDPELPLAEIHEVFGGAASTATVTTETLYEPVASASRGIWRVRYGDRSAVLKVIAHAEAATANWQSGEDPSHWYYWRREVLAYESGLLESLRGGLRAPACLLTAARPDGSVALWLEDLRGTPAPRWNLERYGIAARHLGRAQGAFLTDRALPDDPWLSRGWLRDYLAPRTFDLDLIDDTATWAHPRLAPWFAEPPIAELHAMHRDQPMFIDALDALPRTLCHLDLHPANLFADDGDSTAAIDWSFVGIGAIGEDAGNLVPDTVLDFHFDPARIDDLYEVVAEGYSDGLRDAGWRDPGNQARLGMAATMAAKYAWIAPAMLHSVASDRELINRRPIDESLVWWRPTVAFLLARAEEARALIGR